MSNNIEDIYQDLDFFSPNGLSNKLFFHYLREIMLISQDGKFLIKEAPYFHGLVVKDVFYNYFGNKEYYKNLSNIVQDNCSMMCEYLTLDGCIVFVIENDNCVLCLPNNISDKQQIAMMSLFEDLDIDNDDVSFYVWKCLDNDDVYDKVFDKDRILGRYEFGQEKIGSLELKNYLIESKLKKKNL
ncbi:MAG: hypothetical protein IKF19_04425 [Bacilli bacterium]|nr:hypothetical protein [Bacilli bacterium]